MFGLSTLMDTTPVLYHQIVDDITVYTYMPLVYAKHINQATLDRLSKIYHIGINNDQCTLKDTTQ